MTDNNHNTQHPTPTNRLRWSWFPSLFLGDGMLLSLIVLALVVLRRFGVNNALTTLYISLLCLPFLLRPLFEMVVAHFRGTIKVWILSAEFICTLSLWAIAFTLPTNYWLQGFMCFMPFIIVSGIFYKIAIRRFYINRTDDIPPFHRLIARLSRCASLMFGIGTMTMLSGNMEVLTRNVRYSWSVMFYIMAGIEFFLWLWHSIFLPGGKKPYAMPKDLLGLHRGEFLVVMRLMTRGLRNHFMLFSLLFILPEALAAAISPLLYIDPPHNGGLGLSPQEFGLSFGTIGVVALFAGIHLGNKAIARCGLRRCILPMALLMSLHGLMMTFMSFNTAASLGIICFSTFIGYAALGIGMSAYWTMIDRFANAGSGTELRNAIALGIMSLIIIIAVLFSGLMQNVIGYRQFFLLTTSLYFVPIVIAAINVFVFRK